MDHRKSSMVLALIASILMIAVVIFYRYTKVNLNAYANQISQVDTFISQLDNAKVKLEELNKAQNMLGSANFNILTNFSINFSQNKLQNLLTQIEKLYSSGIVIINTAKIRSENSTLNCTLNGTKVGL